MARIKDNFYTRRRTILGLRVLVAPPAETDGIIRFDFSVRIKHPDGDIDFSVPCFYYWQAFNAARKRILSV